MEDETGRAAEYAGMIWDLTRLCRNEVSHLRGVRARGQIGPCPLSANRRDEEGVGGHRPLCPPVRKATMKANSEESTEMQQLHSIHYQYREYIQSEPFCEIIRNIFVFKEHKKSVE